MYFFCVVVVISALKYVRVGVCANLFFSSSESQQPVKLYFGLPTFERRRKKIFNFTSTCFYRYNAYMPASSRAHPFRFYPKVWKKVDWMREWKKTSINSFNGRINIYILTRIPFDWHFKWCVFCCNSFFAFTALIWFGFWVVVQLFSSLFVWIQNKFQTYLIELNYWINWMAVLISNVSWMFYPILFGYEKTMMDEKYLLIWSDPKRARLVNKSNEGLNKWVFRCDNAVRCVCAAHTHAHRTISWYYFQ